MYSTGDIIVERWLPNKAWHPSRTIRIPDHSRNRIIQYQPLQVSRVREFQRLGVTRADPQVAAEPGFRDWQGSVYHFPRIRPEVVIIRFFVTSY
jgi:hypothetical protein